MASGKWHDRFSLIFGAVLTGPLIALGLNLAVALSFTVGYLFATLMFSPDTDVMPKKRSGILQFFLYPYSILFKHRGLSHMIVIGTLTRIFYGLIVCSIAFYVLHGLGHISISHTDFLDGLGIFLTHYDYNLFEYQVVTWIILGMISADLCHIIVDRLSSLLKKLWNVLFH